MTSRFDTLVEQILEEEQLNEGLLSNIRKMAARGMTIGAIAAVLMLPPMVVKNALAEPSPTTAHITVSKPGASKPRAIKHSRLYDPDFLSDVINKPIPPPEYKSKSKDYRIRHMTDTEVLARTIYNEAGIESNRGKRAVASVIYNRAKGNVSQFVDKVLDRKQFSVWNNDAIPPKGAVKDPSWISSYQIAQELMSGKFQPIITHNSYYNPKLAKPNWARGLAYSTIGNHRFLTVEQIESLTTAIL